MLARGGAFLHLPLLAALPHHFFSRPETPRHNGEQRAAPIYDGRTRPLSDCHEPQEEEMTSSQAPRLDPGHPAPASEVSLLLAPRSPVRRAISAEGVWGRRVLVTGAGGSIGSELVKQISRLGPKHLSLVDSCEFNLYQVSQAVERDRSVKNWSACIGDVRDEVGMQHLFLREAPEVVFHAAALKHVPLLEEHNVVEAVLTNVLGTKIVMDLCAANGLNLVVVSTDKAVNPSSQMGLTKRVAEIYVHDRALRHPEARVGVVRFGNVIGSSGSVVPLFRKQIETGGPITVTHPDMTRYLMTIEDAVRLTLAAASLSQSGYGLYVLEMGSPVRIFDLAVEMIQRAGKRPFVDIDVAFVGIRPGEKLHEELHYAWEHLSPTPVAGVRSAIPIYDPRPKLRHINELISAARARDREWVRRALVEVVPEFAPSIELRDSGAPTAVETAKRCQKRLSLDQRRNLLGSSPRAAVGAAP
jgi:O-antigen biosynthesis protein WbqV